MSKFIRLHFGGALTGRTGADFHLRMARVAIAVAWVTIGGIAVALLMHRARQGETGREAVFALLALAAVVNLGAYVVPWSKLIHRYGGSTIFSVWSLALFAFGSAVVYFSPWLDSQLYLLYFPVILFVVATLGQRGQAIVIALGVGGYALAVQLSAGLPPSDLILRLAGLALVALLGGYVTREQRETALENVRLYVESRHASEELRRVFNRFGRAMASSLEPDKMLQVTADLALGIVGADAAMVILLEQQGDVNAMEAASGPRQAELRWLHQKAGESLVSSIVRSRGPVQVPDMANDARWAAFAADLAGRLGSYLGVPLLLRGRVVGLLAVGRTEPTRYPPDEVELLTSFANQAAIAFENAQLFATLQERLRELSGLHEISLAFASLTKLEDTYGQLVERIARLLDVERCVILLPDEGAQHLVAQAPAYGLSAEQVQTMRIPIGERSAAARVWLSGRPYLTNEAQTDPRNVHRWVSAFGDRSLVVVPMRVEGKTVGLLRASNKRSDRFTNNDVRLLTIFATQAAVALRNAMLYREAAHQRARLEAIFDNASDGIMILDQRGSIVAFNHAMEAISGWKADDAIGRSCSEVCPMRDEKGFSFCDVVSPIREPTDPNQPGPYFESCITTRDGRQRDVGISYSLLASPEGEVYGVAIVRDISKAKELERVKSQFISTVSHELRTPLASIKASIGLLLASIPESTPEPLLRLLHNIERSGRRLESLVSDLLDLARLQSGRVTLRPRHLDLREVVNAAAATMRPLVEEKAQRLELQLPAEPCYVNGDRQRLEQVLLNLLSNAHKYTPDGGQITVRIARSAAFSGAEPDAEVGAGLKPVPTPRRGASAGGPGWWVAVADTGPGIPREEQEYIFERFYRVEDQETKRTVGTGLGLPIAKALVELHGGHIWVDSRPGQGSTFYFSLPEEGDYEDSGD